MLREDLQAALPSNAHIVSSSQVAFPRLAPMTGAYRVEMLLRQFTGDIHFTTDLILFGKGHTEVALSAYGTQLDPLHG